jgi:hypothetical protein
MDDNGDLLADTHNILNRWKNYFPQLLNVHRISDVWQMKIRTARPLLFENSRSEPEIATAKLKIIIHQVLIKCPHEVVQVWGKILRSEIHKLINS